MAPTVHELMGRAGESCPGGQCDNTPSSEKAYIAAGSAVCGAVVLTVGGILLYRRLRTRSKEKSTKAANDSMATPMMSNYAPSTFSFHTPQPQNTYQPPARPLPPLSPISGSGASYYGDADLGFGSSGSGSTGSSSSGHDSLKSPMSDHSSQFAFPILSADGHLMPPVPASSRKSWNISEGDLGAGAGGIGLGLGSVRPLPLAPGDEGLAYDYTYDQNEGDGEGYDYIPYETSSDDHSQVQSLKAPVPLNPAKRWSYEPPIPEVVGLYPSSVDLNLRREEHDHEYEYTNDYEHGYGYDNASIRSNYRTPKVQDTFGFHQPQSATFHTSFSAEGEDLRA